MKVVETIKLTLAIAFWLVLFAGAVLTLYQWLAPEPEVEKESTSPFSEDCVFYRKTVGGDMVISEPSAGTYRYEVYATSDGVEVWKCNNF